MVTILRAHFPAPPEQTGTQYSCGKHRGCRRKWHRRRNRFAINEIVQSNEVDWPGLARAESSTTSDNPHHGDGREAKVNAQERQSLVGGKRGSRRHEEGS